MGFTSAWSISAHDDSFIVALAPRLLPLIAAERDEPLARERWERGRREPLPDFRTWWKPGWSGGREADALDSFLELTTGGGHVQKMYDGLPPDDFSLLTDVWDLVTGPEEIFISVQSKEFALQSLFHAIGPGRAAALPGWCGNFLLTSAEVHETLPAVERALTFTPRERAAAEAQDWLDYCEDEENVPGGPLMGAVGGGGPGEQFFHPRDHRVGPHARERHQPPRAQKLEALSELLPPAHKTRERGRQIPTLCDRPGHVSPSPAPGPDVRIYPHLLAMKYPRLKVPPNTLTAAIAVTLRPAPTRASASSDSSVTHVAVKRMTPMANLRISMSSDSSWGVALAGGVSPVPVTGGVWFFTRFALWFRVARCSPPSFDASVADSGDFPSRAPAACGNIGRRDNRASGPLDGRSNAPWPLVRWRTSAGPGVRRSGQSDLLVSESPLWFGG
jgi:hypothetical protein